MASAGDGAIGGEAGRRKNQKRISDCLGDSDGADEVAVVDDVAAGAESPPSPGTPRLRVPMFTCARFRFVRLGRKGGGGGGGGGQKEQVAAEKSEAASVDSSGWKAASSGSGGGGGGGSASAEAGMGLSLLFLLAKTCVELNKMAEVRAQMEALLEEMRDQLAITKSTDHAAAPPRTRDLQPSTTASPCRASGTDTDGGRAGAASSSSSKPARPRFHRLQEGGKRRGDEFYGALTGKFDLGRVARAAAASSSAMETVSSGESETASGVESPATAASMDLAGQFQLNRNTDEQETSESSESGSDGEFIELEGGFGAANNNNPRRRDSVDGGDEEEHGDGVSALELERRLQELRHRRNRERIEELESSLRRAERKLMEKEMEARVWKDTAKLALQPPTPPPASSSGAGHASCMQ